MTAAIAKAENYHETALKSKLAEIFDYGADSILKTSRKQWQTDVNTAAGRQTGIGQGGNTKS